MHSVSYARRQLQALVRRPRINTPARWTHPRDPSAPRASQRAAEMRHLDHLNWETNDRRYDSDRRSDLPTSIGHHLGLSCHPGAAWLEAAKNVRQQASVQELPDLYQPTTTRCHAPSDPDRTHLLHLAS